MVKKKKRKSLSYYTGNVSIIFVTLMVSFFPLYLSDRYYYIRHDKLYAFYALAGILVIAMGCVLLTNYTPKEKKIHSDKKNKLSITDYSIISFFITSIISTLLSTYKMASFTGTLGRNNGLILTFAYVVVYFIISRTYKENKVVPIVMAVFSSIVAFIGILQQFYWDPLDLYHNININQCLKFISTIGNRNIFSAYLTIVMPLCLVLFILSEKYYQKIIYSISTMITFGGIVCCNSDGSILGTIGVFIFCFIFFSRNLKRFSNLLIVTSLMLIGCKLIRIFSYIMDDYSMGFSSIENSLVYGNTYIIIGVTLALGVFLNLFSNKKDIEKTPKILTLVFVFLTILMIGLGIFIFCYFTFIDTKTTLKGVMKYFRFNDNWGTHRGFMWIRAFYIFLNVNIVQKIFGTGCDTFGQIMTDMGYNKELMAFKSETTNAAHNVYLNYLVTVGIAGVCSYITFIVSAIIRGIKQSLHNKYCVVLIASAISYGLQSFVNIDQPITTPLFIVVIALLENYNRIKA